MWESVEVLHKPKLKNSTDKTRYPQSTFCHPRCVYEWCLGKENFTYFITTETKCIVPQTHVLMQCHILLEGITCFNWFYISHAVFMFVLLTYMNQCIFFKFELLWIRLKNNYMHYSKFCIFNKIYVSDHFIIFRLSNVCKQNHQRKRAIPNNLKKQSEPSFCT